MLTPTFASGLSVLTVTSASKVGAVVPALIVIRRDFRLALLRYPQTTLPLLTETHDILFGDERAADVVSVLLVADPDPVQSM